MARGVAQKTVTLGELTKFAVALPPYLEQEYIVAEVERRLSVLNALEMSVRAGLIRAERLRQSILTEAFAGRLTPQEPGDESAYNLIARIRAAQFTVSQSGRTLRRVATR